MNIEKNQLDKESFVCFNNKFQGVLPIEYLDFLNEYNGGYLDLNSVKIHNHEINSSSIDCFFGINLDSLNDIEISTNGFIDIHGKKYMAIARDLGGNYFYICIKGKHIGKIYFWELHSNSIVPIYDDFVKFIDAIEFY